MTVLDSFAKDCCALIPANVRIRNEDYLYVIQTTFGVSRDKAQTVVKQLTAMNLLTADPEKGAGYWPVSPDYFLAERNPNLEEMWATRISTCKTWEECEKLANALYQELMTRYDEGEGVAKTRLRVSPKYTLDKQTYKVIRSWIADRARALETKD